MLRYIPLIFLIGSLTEIASMVIVGQWIGVLPVLLLVMSAGVAGIALIRTGGMSVAAALRQPRRAQLGQSSSAVGGVFRVFSGLLLIVPGFVSDIAALCLLLPPVQRRIAGFLWVSKTRYQAADSMIIEAEAVEIEDEIADVPRPENARKRLDS